MEEKEEHTPEFGAPVEIGDRVLIFNENRTEITGSGTIAFGCENDRHATKDKWSWFPRCRQVQPDDNYLTYWSLPPYLKKCDIISIAANDIRVVTQR